MNHIYKVVYCKATNTFVAVTEYARAQGKSSSGAVGSGKGVGKFAKVLALTALSSAVMLASGTANAAKIDGTNTIAGNTTNLVIASHNGPNGTIANATNQIVIGNSATTVGTGGKAIAIGSTSAADAAKTTASANYAVALGSSAQATESHSVAIGGSDGNEATKTLASGNAAVALGSNAKATGAYAIATGLGSQGGGANSIAIGRGAVADENVAGLGGVVNADYASNSILKNNNSGHNIAIGTSAKATGGTNTSAASSIAIGYKTSGDTQGSVAIGGESVAGGRLASGDFYNRSSNGVAGGSASAYGQQIAVGSRVQAYGDQSMAFGNNTLAAGNSSIAIGGDDVGKILNTNYTPAMSGQATNKTGGQLYTELTGGSLRGVDYGTTAGDASIAIGMQAKAGVKDSTANVEEFNNQPSNRANRDGAFNIAVGTGTLATKLSSTAIGTGAQATAAGANAMGAKAVSASNNSIAIGTAAENSGKVGSVRGWELNSSGQFVQKALGSNEAETGAGQIAIGQGAKTTAGLIGSRQVSGEHAIAIGTGALTEQMQDIAVGAGAKVERVRNGGALVGAEDVLKNGGGRPASVALGAQAKSGGTHGDTIIGAGANSSSNTKEGIGQATAIGSRAIVYGDQALAIGADTRAIGNSSVAIGGDDINVAIETLKKTDSKITGIDTLDNVRSHLADKKEAQDLVNTNAQYPNTASIGDASVAVGAASQTLGVASVATGANALAYGDGSIAMGLLARSGDATTPTNAKDTVAIGTHTEATGNRAIAIGRENVASGSQSIAIGVGNKVTGENSGAFGDPSINAGTASYSFGNDNVVGSSTTGAFVLGNNNQMGATPSYQGGTKKVDNTKDLTVGSAESASNSVAIGNENKVTTTDTFILGSGINVGADGKTAQSGTVANSVYLGKDSTIPTTGTNNLKADGTAGTTTTGGATGTVNNATVGTGANAVQYSGFAGATATGAVTVGSADGERRIMNVAAGQISETSTDAINGSQLYAVAKKLQETSAAAAPQNYFHVNPSETAASANGSNNLDAVDGVGQATGGQSVAAGFNASSQGKFSVAVGKNAKADNYGGIAIGESAQAVTGTTNPEDQNTLAKAIAIGSGANASNNRTVAIGDRATASGTNANAIGSQTNVSGSEATGIGVAAKVTGNFATGIGQRVQAVGFQSTAIGTQALASDGDFPNDRGVIPNGGRATAIGRSAVSVGERATAVGSDSAAVSNYALAMGGYSKASAENTIAIGRGANANAQLATAIGRSATALATSSIAIGESAFAGNKAAQKAYNDAYQAKEKEIYDAAFGNATGTNIEKELAAKAAVAARQSEVIKAAQDAAKAAAGDKTGDKAIAIGNNAQATGNQSIAIGVGNVVSGNNAGAFGDPSIIAGAGSYSMGNDNAVGATTSNVGIFGNNNQIGATATYGTDGKLNAAAGLTDPVDASGSRVVGNNNKVTAKNTFVVGNNVTATAANNVILGNDSSESSPTTTNGVPNAVDKAVVGGVSYSGFAGDDKVKGIVSVGSAEATRQIINVAPGKISADSTDAINGSQLYLVAKGLTDQMPVIYTDSSGNKVIKSPNGNFYPAGTALNADGSPVDTSVQPVQNVIASMNDGDNVANSPKTLANVAGNFNGAAPSTAAPTTASTGTPDAATHNNAATVGDVLNAGWNLQGNSTAKDFVRHADTVNFVDGQGTTAVVTTNGAGTSSDVTYNVNVDNKTTKFTYLTKAGSTVYQHTDGKYYTEDGGKGNVVDAAEIAGSQITAVAPAAIAGTTVKAGDGITVNQAGNDVTVAVDKTPLTVSNNKVDEPAAANAGKIATAGDVAKAINGVGFTVKANDTAKGDDVINAGDTLNFKDGANTKAVVDGNSVTVNVAGLPVQYTAPDGTPVAKVGDKYFKVDATGKPTTEEVKPADLVASVINPAATPNKKGDATTLGNIKGNLPKTYNIDALNPASTGTKPTTSQALPSITPAQLNNAATVGDVLNAGWNLQGNGKAVDFVKPYDAVNFADGKGSKVSVTANDAGTVNTIKYDVDYSNLTVTDAAGNKVAITGDVASGFTLTLPAGLGGGSSLANGGGAGVPTGTSTSTPTAIPTNTVVNGQGTTATTTTNDKGQNVIQIDSPVAYVNKDASGKPTNDTSKPSDTTKLVGADSKPVQLGNVASGVRDEVAKAAKDPANPTDEEVRGAIAGATGGTLNNAATIGDLKSVMGKSNQPSITSNDGTVVATPITNAAGATTGYDLSIAPTVSALNKRIDDVAGDANAGVSSAMAMAALPQAYIPGKSMVTGGVASYNGQGAVAVGLSKLSDNGRWVLKISGSADTQGNVGGAVGAGFHF